VKVSLKKQNKETEGEESRICFHTNVVGKGLSHEIEMDLVVVSIRSTIMSRAGLLKWGPYHEIFHP
jgi:hypothetical protein